MTLCAGDLRASIWFNDGSITVKIPQTVKSRNLVSLGRLYGKLATWLGSDREDEPSAVPDGRKIDRTGEGP